MKKYLIRNKFFLPLITIPIILSLIGLVFIFEASAIRSLGEYNDSLHYLKYQAIWLGVGLLVMSFFSFFVCLWE